MNSSILVSVGTWAKEHAANKSQKLKDIANNVYSNFKVVAQVLVVQLYELTPPLGVQEEEVKFRQLWVTELLTNYRYLNGTQMVSHLYSMLPFYIGSISG